MSLSKIELPPSESSSRPSSRALTESSNDESTANLPVSINSSRPASCLNPIPESGSEKSYKKIDVIELEVENNNYNDPKPAETFIDTDPSMVRIYSIQAEVLKIDAELEKIRRVKSISQKTDKKVTEIDCKLDQVIRSKNAPSSNSNFGPTSCTNTTRNSESPNDSHQPLLLVTDDCRSAVTCDTLSDTRCTLDNEHIENFCVSEDNLQQMSPESKISDDDEEDTCDAATGEVITYDTLDSRTTAETCRTMATTTSDMTPTSSDTFGDMRASVTSLHTPTTPELSPGSIDSLDPTPSIRLKEEVVNNYCQSHGQSISHSGPLRQLMGNY